MIQKFPLACYAAQYMRDHARNSPEETLEPSILDVICHLLSHPNKRKPLLALLDALNLIRSGFYSSGSTNSRIDAQDLTPEPPKVEMPELFDTALELAEHYQSNVSSVASTVTATSDDTTTDDENEKP